MISKLLVPHRDAQEYLDEKYPLKKRDKISKLNFIFRLLSGELIIDNWPELKWIILSSNSLTKITLSNCPKFSCLSASENKLINLTIVNCPNLHSLYLKENQLTDLDFLTNLNKEKIIILDISRNKFPSQDLTVFSQFINLKTLTINHNSFTGNLAPLKYCRKLEWLTIGNTQIDSGLEYLPESCQNIRCDGQLAEQLKKHTNLLLDFLGKTSSFLVKPLVNKKEAESFYTGSFAFKSWRKDYAHELLKIAEKTIEELEKQISNLSQIILQLKDQINKAYLYFFTEEEQNLVQKVIDINCSLTRAKKERLPSLELEKEKITIMLEVIRRLGNEKGEKLQLLLTDFENLIQKEMELKDKQFRKERVESEREHLFLVVNNEYSGNLVTFVHNDNNYNFTGAITSNQGHVLIGNQIGDNANFSHNTTEHYGDVIANEGGIAMTGITNATKDININNPEYQTQIEQPPK